MKFRGVMIDAVPMREFTNIVMSVSKLCKECVLRLSQNKVYFIVTEEGLGPKPPAIWCELDQSSFFSEYHMEGVDDLHKDIYLGLLTAHLARSLLALKKNAKSIKIKLTKKQTPCLTLEIDTFSMDMISTRQITHDIPITVIPRKAWDDFSAPSDQNYHISIEMPTFKQLKATVDRMKNLSSNLILRANSIGHMILQIKTELVTVSSKFQNLIVDSFNDKDDESDDEFDGEDNKDFITCKIDIKSFCNFLNANQNNCAKFSCSMVHHKLVMLYFEKESILSFQCFIPCIVS